MRIGYTIDGGRFVHFEATPAATCELCVKEAELRPYGPNGERICFDCGMKDEETTNKKMGEFLFGDK